MYSLGLLILWLLSHGHPTAPSITELSRLKSQKHQVHRLACNIVTSLPITDQTRSILELLFFNCFCHDPSERASSLEIPVHLNALSGEEAWHNIDGLATTLITAAPDTARKPLLILATLLEQCTKNTELMDTKIVERTGSTAYQISSLADHKQELNVRTDQNILISTRLTIYSCLISPRHCTVLIFAFVLV
jgi:hypothetical protein